MSDRPHSSDKVNEKKVDAGLSNFADEVYAKRENTLPRNQPGTDKPGNIDFIHMNEIDDVFNKDGFATKDSLKAALSGRKGSLKDGDIKQMLGDFDVLSKQFDDKDGGKKGISRDDVAKYTYPIDKNHISDEALKVVGKTGDGMITRDALQTALQRKDLTEVQRDDIKYMQHQYNQLKGEHYDGKKNDIGLSKEDIFAANRKIEQRF